MTDLCFLFKNISLIYFDLIVFKYRFNVYNNVINNFLNAPSFKDSNWNGVAVIAVLLHVLKETHLALFSDFFHRWNSHFNRNPLNLEFHMRAKNLQCRLHNRFKLVTLIHHTDQQKAAWFETDFCVNSSVILNITTI